jgi:hypothetical protein
MAYIRAFDNPSILKLSSSDLSIRRRDKTIFNEIRQNVDNLITNNPVKENGYTYSNVKINVTCDISGGSVEYVDTYEKKSSISNGRNVINEVCGL